MKRAGGLAELELGGFLSSRQQSPAETEEADRSAAPQRPAENRGRGQGSTVLRPGQLFCVNE